LAGGASRRFGGIPKGLQEVAGRRIIDRVTDALKWVTPEIVVVANSPDASNWLPGVAVLRDRVSDAGGLAGVDAALGSGTDAIVVAWDMPFVIPELLQLIVGAANANDADIVVPESQSPNGFEPFCAFYSARIGASLAAFLKSQSAPRDFLAATERVVRIPLAEVAKIGDPARLFMSVNSAEDLMRARAEAETGQ